MRILIILCSVLSFPLIGQSVIVSNVNGPWGIDVKDGYLYIGENGDGQVTRFDLNDPNATLQTVAGGLNGCSAVKVVGLDLFIGERNSNVISKVNLADNSFAVTECTTLEFPPIGFELHENYLYTATREGNGISRIDLDNGCPTIFGTPVSGLDQAYGIGLFGDMLFMSESNAGKISVVNLSTGKFVKEDFVDGLATPGGMTVVDSILYIADFGSGNLESIDLRNAEPVVETVMTNLDGPLSVASENGIVYIAEFNANRIRSYPEVSNTENIINSIEESLSLYPNPATHEVIVNTSVRGSLNYSISDLLGRVVLTGNILDGASIDVEKLDSGQYIFQLENQSIVFIKE